MVACFFALSPPDFWARLGLTQVGRRGFVERRSSFALGSAAETKAAEEKATEAFDKQRGRTWDGLFLVLVITPFWWDCVFLFCFRIFWVPVFGWIVFLFFAFGLCLVPVFWLVLRGSQEENLKKRHTSIWPEPEV